MLFNSYIFILFFLPLTLILYYGLNHFRQENAAKIALIVMSLWFYAYFHVDYLIIILLSVLVNYGISRIISVITHDTGRKMILFAGITGNIAVIFYFKYFNFVLDNVNYFLHTSFPLCAILMPLGISFFTFQQISYLVDSYRNETKSYGFVDYALFVTFFPQLIAGPIVFHEEMIPQFRDSERKKFNHEKFAMGLYCFAVGLSKKVLLADTMGKAVDWGFANPGSLSAAGTLVLSVLYVFQLYFDFSGYCDMAYGIASMFHIDLPINFNSPYKALSISDFWQRWHMSLTRFLRKYIYIPLGGNRKGKNRTWINILVVYLVSGVWHGANWTFILWGGLHGIAQVVDRIFGNVWKKLPRLLQWLGTFLFFDFTVMLFRADSIRDFLILIRNLLTGKPGGIAYEMLQKLDVIELTYLEDHIGALKLLRECFQSVHMWVFLGISFFITLFGRNCYEREFKPDIKKAIECIVLLIWSVMSLSGLSSFLYFNF